MRVKWDLSEIQKALPGIAIDIQEALKDKLTSGVDPTGMTTRTSRGVFQSHLKTSIKGVVKPGNKVDISMLEYGKYLEFGTPHIVNDFSGLRDWVKEKILNDKNYSDKTIDRITESVKKQIETKGMVPFPFIRLVWQTELNKIIHKNLKKK